MCAAGEIKQQLSSRTEFLIGRVEQNAANLPADGGATGLNSLEYVLPFGAQTLREQTHLRALPAAVDSLEGDEPAPLWHLDLFIFL